MKWKNYMKGHSRLFTMIFHPLFKKLVYAKNWSKREQVELKYLSEWKDQLKELVADRISNLKGHFKSPKCKVLDQPDVKDTLHK